MPPIRMLFEMVFIKSLPPGLLDDINISERRMCHPQAMVKKFMVQVNVFRLG